MHARLDPSRPNIDPYLDSVLRDWGRWARAYPRGGPRRCASLEGRYLPEAGEVWADECRPLPPDERLAWHIETVWREHCPLRERLLLRAHYVLAPNRGGDAWPAYVRRTSRQLGIRPAEWGASVSTSARIIGGFITRW